MFPQRILTIELIKSSSFTGVIVGGAGVGADGISTIVGIRAEISNGNGNMADGIDAGGVGFGAIMACGVLIFEVFGGVGCGRG